MIFRIQCCVCPFWTHLQGIFCRVSGTGQPFPLHLFYVEFVLDTGWLVRIHVATWKQECLPERWRCLLSAAWIHETSYPNLVLARQFFSKQSTTFLHALKLIVKRLELPIQFGNSPALLSFQHTLSVSPISLWPNRLHTLGYQPLLDAAGASTLRAFFQKKYCPCVVPSHPSIEKESPACCGISTTRRDGSTFVDRLLIDCVPGAGQEASVLKREAPKTMSSEASDLKAKTMS